MRLQIKRDPTGKPVRQSICLRPASKQPDPLYAPMVPEDVVEVPDDIEFSPEQFEVTDRPANRPWRYQSAKEVRFATLGRNPSPAERARAAQVREDSMNAQKPKPEEPKLSPAKAGARRKAKGGSDG